MDVGQPQREIIVEPLQLPEPLRPVAEPDRERSREPSREPEKEPVHV